MSVPLNADHPFETDELIEQRARQRRLLSLVRPAWLRRYDKAVLLHDGIPDHVVGAVEASLRALADELYTDDLAADLEPRAKGVAYRLAVPLLDGPVGAAINNLPNNGTIQPEPVGTVARLLGTVDQDEAVPRTIEPAFRNWITTLLLAESLTDGAWLDAMGLKRTTA